MCVLQYPGNLAKDSVPVKVWMSKSRRMPPASQPGLVKPPDSWSRPSRASRSASQPAAAKQAAATKTKAATKPEVRVVRPHFH
jgi:hypothetical protein